MKQIIYYAIVILLFAVAMTGYEFTTTPLMFKVNNWKEFLGWVMLIVAVAIISSSQQRTEYFKGYEDALKDLKNYSDKF